MIKEASRSNSYYIYFTSRLVFWATHMINDDLGNVSYDSL